MFDMLPWGSRPPACVLVGSCPCARVLCPLRSIALPYSTRSLLILFPSSPIPHARCPAYPPFAIPSPAFVSFCLIPLTFYLPPLLFPYPSPLSLLAEGGGGSTCPVLREKQRCGSAPDAPSWPRAPITKLFPISTTLGASTSTTIPLASPSRGRENN